MRVCKKMNIYLGIKNPQSRKERKYTWEKPHVYRVIILKQMADHKFLRLQHFMVEFNNIQYWKQFVRRCLSYCLHLHALALAFPHRAVS